MRTILYMMLILLTGCAPSVVRERNQKDYIYMNNYKLGNTQATNIGDPVVSVKQFILKDAPVYLKTDNEFVIQGTYCSSISKKKDISIHAKSNEEYDCKGVTEIDSEQFFVFELQDVKGEYYGVLVHKNGSLYVKAIVNNGSEYLMTSNNSTVTPEILNYKILQKSEESNTITIPWWEHFEIIYTGISSNTINMTYREYTSQGIARQAFFQNLSYPLDSEIIRFKNMKVKIHSVSSERIVYTVIEDGFTY